MKLAFILENGDDLWNDIEVVHDESVVSAEDEICTNDQLLQFQYGKDGGHSEQSTNTITGPVQSGSPHTTIGLFVRQQDGSPEVHD